MSPVHTRTKGLPFHPLYFDGGDGHDHGHSDDRNNNGSDHHNNNGSDHNNNNNNNNNKNNNNENGGGTLKSRSVGRIGRSGRNSSSKRPPPKDQPTLRRSSRKRTMHVMLDYESETDGEDDYHLRQRPFRMSRSRKSHPKSNPDEHNDRIPIIPRREGLRPRQGAQVARQDYSQDSEEEEDEQVLLSSPSEDEADREGGDADGTERAGREDEEFEEREGCRRYALRNRTEIQRFSPRMEDKPMPKPFHIKRNRDGKRRSDKRHRSSRADDSDDSLLIDEMAQVPGGASFLKAGSFNQHILFGGLDLSGFSNRSLNIAATGWGHQSDNWSGATAGGASGAQTTAGLSHKGGADIQPIQVDDSLGFDQVGGLSHYTQALKEMVFFPLLYPKFFDNYGITPPRGVLLCGPPGTGKTLVARALAASASRAGQKVSFYMRKGADVLSKWVGEAERQLRMLFEEAQRNQPSIIFFDEIDGLAPVRSSKQEQIHNSIVSTLLALMDGLDSRGQVVVIGATNRVDAIDGALRRPGRFDRELIFSLPDSKAREEILEIHTRKWQDPPSEEVRKELAAVCVGYCGADLKALCTEAAIRAFRKKYPQVYNSDEQLLIDADSVKVKKRDFLEVMSTIIPAAQRGALVQSMPLSVTVLPLLENQLKKIMGMVTEIFPMSKSEDCLSIPDDENDDSFDQLAMFSTLQHGSAFPFVYKPRLLLSGKEGAGLEHMGPAVLHELERFPMHSLSLPCLLSDMGSRTSEEALVNIFREAKRTTPSVLYLPQLDLWWDTAHKQLQTVLLMLLNELPSSLPVLLLGTTKVPQFDLDEQARRVFLGHIYELGAPKADDRAIFFSQLVDTVLAMNDQKGHSKEKQEIFPELAKAPKKERSPTEAELRAQAEEEEHALRRLRMCLREVCNRLLYEKCFGTFHYPVLEEDAPDYHSIVKSPMDVATLLQRVDAGHYMTRSAFLQDLELIPINAKVYHGDDYNGARIVSKALALRDAAHGMLSQMDKELVCECDAIADRGGPIKCPASNGQMHSSALGQSGNVTRASARLRGFQPEIDLSQTQEIHHRRTRRNSDGEHTGGDAATAVMGTSGGDHNIASSLKMRELNSNTEEVPSKEVAFSVPQGEAVVVSQGTDSSSQLYKEQSSQCCSSLVHLIDPHTITSMENGHPVNNSEAAEQVQTNHRGEHSHEARFDNDSFSKGVDKIKKRFVKYTRGYEVSQLEQVHARVCQTIRNRAGGSGRASLLEMLEKFVSDMNTGKFELEHEAEADY